MKTIMLVRILLPLLLLSFVAVDVSAQQPVVTHQPTDWPWWRGQTRDGIAPPDQQPPTHWSETENILWRAKIAGRGHGSATVLGDQVFLAIADPQREVQAIVCLDRGSGTQLWETIVHRGGFKIKGKKQPNEKASLASATPATDGKRLYINFYNDHAVWTTAVDRSGKKIWQQKITDYVVHQGFGSSPAIYGDLVIVSADNKGGGAIVALQRDSGEEKWRRQRPEKPNYASPAILHASDRDQLVFTGCDLVTSLDPATGKELWEIDGSTTECVTTAVTDGTHVFTSGGYPKNHISAVAADGSGKIVWENNTRAYVPSMLQHGGYLFLTLDAGIATCFRCSDGEQMWKARLGGTFSSSPVLVGEQIYATNEDGETFVFLADPDKYTSVSKNKLGTSVFATPTICGDRIYTRVTQMENGTRQEYLYCIGH